MLLHDRAIEDRGAAEKARKALGDKFSLREYHNVVLNTGTVPLEILERQVDAWIQAKLKSKL